MAMALPRRRLRRLRATPLVLPLVVLGPPSRPTPFASADVTRGTVVLRRGADPGGAIAAALDPAAYAEADAAAGAPSPCAFDGVVSLSHPMSLAPGDKFFSTGQLQLKAIEMMVDEINTRRCGVSVDGKQYGIELTTFGDDSSKEKVGAIVENAMLPLGESSSPIHNYDASFWLGPYSSGLTGIMSPFANETNSILVAGGAAATSVFKGYDTVFGTFPPTKEYLAQAIEALAGAGAKSVASVWEDASFTRGVCAALDSLAPMYGMEIKSRTEVPSSPTSEALDPVARNLSMSELDPDAVVTCVYAEGCAQWISSLRKAKWTPRAQVFTVCIGMDSFNEAAGTDAQYMTGISPWDPSLPIKDDVVGWSAEEFAEKFEAYTSRTPTYHSASGAASVGIMVQAIERVGSFDSNRIAEELASGEFTTLYGKVSFDANGQSKAPSLFLQYDAEAAVQTVYPLESRSGELVYPMPKWEERDCKLESTCESGAVPGTCRQDGTCECQGEAITEGIGPNASCKMVPEEDSTYISTALVAGGIVLFALQAILALFCAAWTYYYRSRNVVRASQPIFLCLIAFGVFVLNLTLIPIGIQGKYRYVKDPTTGRMTDEPDPDIAKVDAACMAVPWLFSMGFSIIFSALFAKIWRVMRVLKAAQRCQRKTVKAKDVAVVMICVVSVQMLILLCWQLLDPMRWHREIVSSDINGFPTKSVGHCKSDTMLTFIAPLLAIDGLMLLYALYLCFQTRNVPSDLQEGQWITGAVLSIVQILIISIPIIIITTNNNDAFYFVRAAVVFLMGLTVTALVFFPKMYRLRVGTQRRRGGDITGTTWTNNLSARFNLARRDDRRQNVYVPSANSGTSPPDGGSVIPARWTSNFQSSGNKASVEDVSNLDLGILEDDTKIIRFADTAAATNNTSNCPSTNELGISNDPSRPGKHSTGSDKLEARDHTNPTHSESRQSNEGPSDAKSIGDGDPEVGEITSPGHSVSRAREEAPSDARSNIDGDDSSDCDSTFLEFCKTPSASDEKHETAEG